MKPGELVIEVSPRSKEQNPGRLRREAQIPGIVYGTAMKAPVSLMASGKTLLKYGGRAFETTIFSFKSADKSLNDLKVLFKSVDRHPVTRKPLHVDFMAVDMNKPVRIPVEIRLEGKAAGLANGGVVQPILRELMVECLPSHIPEYLAADISPLEIHESLHISDLKMPEGVKPVTHENLTIVTITVIKEEAAAPVAAAAATTAEPEVIGKGKKPEEGAAPAAGGAAPAGGAAKAEKK